MLTGRLPFLLRRAISSKGEQNLSSGAKIVIVDAGCGDGRNLQFIANACQAILARYETELRFELVGIDLCDSAVQQARRALQALGLPEQIGWRIHERNIVEEIPVVTDGTDILVCADTFGQLYPSEVPHSLAEWKRALRRGGMLVLNAYTPDDETRRHCERDVAIGGIGSEIGKRHTNAWWYRNTYYKDYTRNELSLLMRESKFAVVEMTEEQWVDPPHPGYREKGHKHYNWVVVAESPE